MTQCHIRQILTPVVSTDKTICWCIVGNVLGAVLRNVSTRDKNCQNPLRSGSRDTAGGLTQKEDSWFLKESCATYCLSFDSEIIGVIGLGWLSNV